MVNQKEEVKQKSGDILAYTKSVERFVVDENGNQIACKSDAEAKTLSLLFEIRELLKRGDKN